jgi:ABC-type multidrug transport system fused ATPase/permease subunit
VPEFSAVPGELVAVVGRVGAGKSSLFQAILGNMDPTQGTAETGGRVSFVPQNPWCQNLTLRDNILFGLPFDEEKYERVSCLLCCCCLLMLMLLLLLREWQCLGWLAVAGKLVAQCCVFAVTATAQCLQ